MDLSVGLPIFNARKDILALLRQHETLVLVGDTGTGKTTQLPKFLLTEDEAKAFGRRVCVTQPRRVAAISVANRVAKEMKVELGKLVGYTVRFDNRTCSQTRLRYMTDGMLVREAMNDPLLLRYSVIFLDEAHERSINTDMLFLMVKQAQRLRRNAYKKGRFKLKVIIMSATLDVSLFVSYFATKDRETKPINHVLPQFRKAKFKNLLLDQQKVTTNSTTPAAV